MKYCKKALAAALVILIFFSVFAPMPVRAADTAMRYGREKLGQMPNGANLQFVYDRLVAGCGQAQAEFQIDISGRGIDISNDLGLIYSLFYSDYPEYFWITGGWNVRSATHGSSTILTMKPTYTITGSALTAAKTAYDAKVNQLTAGLSGSDYDKAKTLHDRLIDTVTYTSTANDQNAYGALVEGKAVCNGYARAYQHLLMKVGIPAWHVNGTSVNPSTNTPVGHAWNLVKIDGQWYYTDVTWDDQGANTFYTYFHITTQQLLQGHTIDSKFASLVPNATATAANYYIKEGRVFAAYDQTKLVTLLKKDNNKTQIYITGNLSDFVSSLNTNLVSIAEDLGATGSYSISYNMSQLGNALILEIVIIQNGHTHAVRQAIPQVDSSCLSAGTKAYYVCNCGLKFLDQGCTQQVTSDSQLEIQAKAHTPSNWKNDAANHWKECTRCGTETANTRGSHTDGNRDNKCDTCSYALPVPDGGDNTPSTEPADTTPSTEPAGNNPSTENTQTTEPVDSAPNTEPVESTQATEPTDITAGTDPTRPPVTDPTTPSEKTDGSTDSAPDKNPVIWAVIGGAAVIALGIGAAAFVIVKKKSK